MAISIPVVSKLELETFMVTSEEGNEQFNFLCNRCFS
jgi:hypothetical protein